ncbi:MAG: hypothetical protein AB7S36_03760, partial [Planctomycetota bacterium]
YHQKFYLRHDKRLSGPLLAAYPDYVAFTNSTAAMRLNALVDGSGTRELYEAERAQLGLTRDGNDRVTDYIRRLPGPAAD